MRVAIQNGGSTYWLAGQAGVSERVHSSARDFSLSRDRQLTVAPIVHSGFTVQFDRGNESTIATFSTTRKFATAEECFLFMIRYSIPLTGVTVFEVEQIGGGTVQSLMANSVMSKPVMTPIGKTLTIEYTITGGAITAGANEPGGGVGKYLNGTGGGYLNDSAGYYTTGT